MTTERAKRKEETSLCERADGIEQTISKERAIEPEKTKWAERAIHFEKTKMLERNFSPAVLPPAVGHFKTGGMEEVMIGPILRAVAIVFLIFFAVGGIIVYWVESRK